MIRNILNSNLKSLNSDDAYVVKYLTKKPFDWFLDDNVSDEQVRETLINAFGKYFGYAPSDGVHPFYKVWEKISKDALIFNLICQTDLYGDTYEVLANKINELYTTSVNSHNNIVIILKAFARRDFDELADRHLYDDDVTIDYILDNFNAFDDDVVSNLDENDLETILKFCGVFNY